jgi:chemotaxis protein histidine kinase CheA
MAEEQIRSIIDGIRARLQAELDAQLGNLADSHEQAVHAARRSADVDAEERWGSKLDAARAEWEARLASEVAASRAEVERSLAAESTRVRAEAEQAAANAALEARRELDEAVAGERTRAQADLERAQAERERAQADLERAHADLERVQADRERAQAERERTQDDLQRAHTDLEQTKADLQRVHADFEPTKADLGRVRADLECTQADRDRAQADLERAHADLERAQGELQRAHAHAEEIRAAAARELDQAKEAFQAERSAAADAVAAVHEAPSGPRRGASEVLSALRAIDESSSLTAALAAAVRGAALESPRVALFIVNGAVLQEWPVDGVPSVDAGPIRSNGREAGFLADVLRRGEALTIDGTNGAVAPAFAGLARGRRAIAVPFVLGGQPVAVLYADEGANGEPLDSWLETVQIVGRHAASVVTSLTVVRTAQALRLISGGPDNGGATPLGAMAAAGGHEDEAQGARRYAKLLISEIKLYNEGAVRVGRERRDLLRRLKDEIERARRLYDERIAATIPARDAYFEQELVQTLADGDQSLLG